MIEAITGRLTALTPASATLDTPGGVAYLLNITLPCFTALQGRADTRLLVHEIIRDDAWTLYGFLDEQERDMFRALIGVSGVGPGSARLILSAIPARELGSVIAGDDVSRLKGVKGIGAKTAQRIIVDLRGKIAAEGGEGATPGSPEAIAPAGRQAYDEALAALVILGFDRKASAATLTRLFAADPTLAVEAAVKHAMSAL